MQCNQSGGYLLDSMNLIKLKKLILEEVKKAMPILLEQEATDDFDLGGEDLGSDDLGDDGGDMDLGDDGGDMDLGDGEDMDLGDGEDMDLGDDGGDMDLGMGGFGGGGGGGGFGGGGDDMGLGGDEEEGGEGEAEPTEPQDTIPDDPVQGVIDDLYLAMDTTTNPQDLLNIAKSSVQKYFDDFTQAYDVITKLEMEEDPTLQSVGQRLSMFMNGF